ncbi:MAG: aminoacyl-tRNA hydrolase [Candidatus Omnitrophica bacterium]|nr:aminoacyl-tRNA hydrolase [Candidatus Omnitrophota bacterium]MBI3009811.1 aminoacyl-tRNA hydrolase [Candidatus Omnitrophota bacterium]
MNVIVGLGNPGHTFAHTRHNVGFDVIERLARRYQISINQRLLTLSDHRPAAVFGDCEIKGIPVRLLMPLTMMNESGQALVAAASEVAQLLIVCDDVNLPLGNIRIRPRGSSGGHNGLQSCLEALGTEQVARLRVGVGIEPLPSDLRDFVLSRFQSSEWPVIERVLEQVVAACETWVGEGLDATMNRYNTVSMQESHDNP